MRCGFWTAIAGALPEMDAWIVGGDFNNLEALEDQIGRSAAFDEIADNEQHGWVGFMFAIFGRDVWHIEAAFQRLQDSLSFLLGL